MIYEIRRQLVARQAARLLNGDQRDQFSSEAVRKAYSGAKRRNIGELIKHNLV